MDMATLRRRWTVADLRDVPRDGRRYEVVAGELCVTPSPSWAHQEAVGTLYRRLADYLQANRVGHVFLAPADVVFSPTSSVQPDLFVAPLENGRRPERYEAGIRLRLVIEVLSPASARADRVVKRTLYRDEGVDEY